MELILPKGTITWKNRGFLSTLDLVFLSKESVNTVLECSPADELEASSDHIPLCTKLRIEPAGQTEAEPRPQWKKADWERINQILTAKLEDLTHRGDNLSSPEAIDQQTEAITKAVQETVEELVPKAKPSKFALSYWTKECSRVFREARKARRQWTHQGTESSCVNYQKATNRKKKQIRKDKTLVWRLTVAEATKDPAKIWKLAKWARRDLEEKTRLPQISDTKNKEDNILTKDKTKALASHFFPSTVSADLEDIEEYTYPDKLSTISASTEIAEVEEALKKLPGNKTPGPDGIPNQLLKHCRKSLSQVLADIFNACISQGYHPSKFKESITVVLRKPQKPRYDTPKAYRPIALLNTTGKLLEKLVANRISRAAESYNLLPEQQMGA
ncbi:hypothetical protein K3495_g10025 [Podosphaera aphanis]|nr:hypothetical protein K3495_g10025 [Podosphaera aphanis]